MKKNPVNLEELMDGKWIRLIKVKDGFYIEDAAYAVQCEGHRLCDSQTMKKLGQMMVALSEKPEYNSKLEKAILLSELYKDCVFGDNESLKEDLDSEWQETWFGDDKGEE